MRVAFLEGEALGEDELAEVQGALTPLDYLALRGLIGAAGGAIAGAFKSHAETGHVNIKDVVIGAGLGLIAGVTSGVGSLIPKP